MRRQAAAKVAHQRDLELAEEKERKEKLSRADARNREEERVRKAEEHRLQVFYPEGVKHPSIAHGVYVNLFQRVGLSYSSESSNPRVY